MEFSDGRSFECFVLSELDRDLVVELHRPLELAIEFDLYFESDSKPRRCGSVYRKAKRLRVALI